MARTAATEPAPPTSGSGTRYADAASGDAAAEMLQGTGTEDGDSANDRAAVAAPVRADASTRNTAAILCRNTTGSRRGRGREQDQAKTVSGVGPHRHADRKWTRRLNED